MVLWTLYPCAPRTPGIRSAQGIDPKNACHAQGHPWRSGHTTSQSRSAGIANATITTRGR